MTASHDVDWDHQLLREVTMGRFAGILLLFYALAALASDEAPQSPVITLERTGCFGSCPVYKVQIFNDGSVVYEGKQYVRVQGTRRSNIGADAVKGLVQDFLDSDYFSLANKYTSIKNPDGTETVVTDLPTTTTSLSSGDHHKTVVDYVGAPEKLIELEKKVDDVAGTKRWVKIDARSVGEEVQHGWNVNSPDALHLFLDAVRSGDDETVRAFIQAGVNVNALIGNVHALQMAHGVKTINLLIGAGADVNASTEEYFGPPLSFAAEQGDVESIKTLIDAGAKINGRSPGGMTALMNAASQGHSDAVQTLLQAGAQSDARDKEGHGALFYAKDWLRVQSELVKHPQPFAQVTPKFQEKFQRVQELLRAAGATDDPPPAK